MNLPILAEIGDGWYWVQHPNGPAIASRHCISTLNGMFPNTLESDDPELKIAIKATQVLDSLLHNKDLTEWV